MTHSMAQQPTSLPNLLIQPNRPRTPIQKTREFQCHHQIPKLPYLIIRQLTIILTKYNLPPISPINLHRHVHHFHFPASSNHRGRSPPFKKLANSYAINSSENVLTITPDTPGNCKITCHCNDPHTLTVCITQSPCSLTLPPSKLPPPSPATPPLTPHCTTSLTPQSPSLHPTATPLPDASKNTSPPQPTPLTPQPTPLTPQPTPLTHLPPYPSLPFLLPMRYRYLRTRQYLQYFIPCLSGCYPLFLLCMAKSPKTRLASLPATSSTYSLATHSTNRLKSSRSASISAACFIQSCKPSFSTAICSIRARFGRPRSLANSFSIAEIL